MVVRSAENGFPQPDPYDDEANRMVWNQEKRERRKDKMYWSSEENEGGDDNHGDEEGVERRKYLGVFVEGKGSANLTSTTITCSYLALPLLMV